MSSLGVSDDTSRLVVEAAFDRFRAEFDVRFAYEMKTESHRAAIAQFARSFGIPCEGIHYHPDNPHVLVLELFDHHVEMIVYGMRGIIRPSREPG